MKSNLTHMARALTVAALLLVNMGVSAEGMDEQQTAVLKVLTQYHAALQNLTTDGTFELFTEDAQVYEQGGVEGSYPHYVEHHLGPELGHFERFTFSDESANIEVLKDLALVTQTYQYTIVTKASPERESRTIEKQGLATSVLIKTNGGWKIKRTHSSSRALKKK